MNMEFFRLINNLANKNVYLDNIMVFFSKYVPYVFMIVIATKYLYNLKLSNKVTNLYEVIEEKIAIKLGIIEFGN